MLKIGDWNELIVAKIDRDGAYFEIDERNIPMSKGDLPPGARNGDTLEVFIYNDAKESLRATTKKPLAKVGDFALLRVAGRTDFGAFFDWGLQKDLFVPEKYLRDELLEGDPAVVYVMLDYEKTGVIGTCKLERYFSTDVSTLEVGQEVPLLVFDFSPLGVNVVVANRYRGLLYDDDVFEDLNVGDERRGYIKKLRSDGKIDVSLQPQNFPAAADNARDAIMKALQAAGGFLPLHDKSNPEEIKQRLQMSKKIFKKAIGGLYKDRTITIEPGGIRLKQK